MWFPYIATILAVLACAHGYSSGAPSSACENMTPGHPASPQKSQSPYVITTSTKVINFLFL